MAGRNVPLNIDVAAVDRASPVLDGIQADVKEIEGEHKVDVTADDKASDALGDIRSKLDGLTEKDRVIALKAESRQLEREVSKAEGVLKNLSKFDGDQIRVRLEARDNASKKLDAVRTELRQLDGDTATVKVEATDSTGRLGDDGAGGRGGIGGALGVGAAVAGLTAAAASAADTAIQVQAIANRTGAPLEDVSRLVAVFQDSGVEASDLADILYNVNGVLRDNPELADQLGVKIDKNTTLVDLFLQAVKGVETEFTNVGDAAVAASQLFGEEGVRQIDTVIAVVKDLQTGMDNVAKTRVVTDDDVAAARDINAELAETRGHLEAIGLALLGPINGLLGAVVGFGEFVNKYEVNVNDVLNAGGATRRWLLGDANDPNPGMDAVIQRNTSGFHGGAFGQVREPVGTTAHVPQTIIVNPPGTPAATNGQQQQYLRRNGVRLS